jgi:formylmethanofuran dehydrogenase subunit E
MEKRIGGRPTVSEKDELELAINKAVDLHGHLGPFLVVGVRMGRIAKRILGLDADPNGELNVGVSVPFSTPFSCVIDGIQTSTRCTIGNRKLQVKDSKKEISALFERGNPRKVVRICLNPKTVEEIVDRMLRGSSAEELALEIVGLPESRLFAIKT